MLASAQNNYGKLLEIPNFARHLSEFSDARRGHILKKMGESRRFRYRFSDPLIPPFVIMRALPTRRSLEPC